MAEWNKNKRQNILDYFILMLFVLPSIRPTDIWGIYTPAANIHLISLVVIIPLLPLLILFC